MIAKLWAWKTCSMLLLSFCPGSRMSCLYLIQGSKFWILNSFLVDCLRWCCISMHRGCIQMVGIRCFLYYVNTVSIVNRACCLQVCQIASAKFSNCSNEQTGIIFYSRIPLHCLLCNFWVLTCLFCWGKICPWQHSHPQYMTTQNEWFERGQVPKVEWKGCARICNTAWQIPVAGPKMSARGCPPTTSVALRIQLKWEYLVVSSSGCAEMIDWMNSFQWTMIYSEHM